MKVIRNLAVGIVGLAVLIGTTVGLRSLPEIKRYLRIRAM